MAYFRSRLLVRLALGASTLVATEAAAQLPRDRDLAGFRDTLSAASGNDALKSLERSLIVQVANDRSNAGLHVRLGLIALRLGAYSDAASEFKTATRTSANWGEAWLGLARAELALGEVADTSRLGRRALLSQAGWERAATAFSRAAGTGGGQLAAAIEGIALDRLRSGRVDAAQVVCNGLRRAAAGRSPNPASVLVLGRLELQLGDTAAALTAFDAAAALPGGQALGLLEAARLRLARADETGVERYYQAAALADSQSVSGLRADLAWVATADELRRFDATRDEDRARFLSRFWTRRDRNDLRRTGQRLIEHYRRIATALASFSNRDDQRVAVWIRHGPPVNRATLRAADLPANDSWRYRQPAGDLFVHFRATDDSSNYRVMESIYDLVADTGAPAGGDDEAAGGLADRVLQSRAQLAPFYQAAVAGRRDQLAAFRQRERELGRAGQNLALSTDGYPLRFDRDLPARVRIVSLASGTLDVLFALPAFVQDSGGGPSIRVRLVAWDSVDGATLRALDTTVVAEAGPGFGLGRVRLAVPPGRYDSRLALEVGNQGTTVAESGTLVVGPQSGPVVFGLTIGAVGSELGWTLPSGRVLADPAGVFGRPDTLAVAAGLAGRAGTTMRVRPMWRRIRSDGREEKWRRWSGVDWASVRIGSEGSGRVEVLVEARHLSPGQYEVGLAVDGGDRPPSGQPGRVVIIGATK